MPVKRPFADRSFASTSLLFVFTILCKARGAHSVFTTSFTLMSPVSYNLAIWQWFSIWVR